MSKQFEYKAVAPDGSHRKGTINAVEIATVEQFLNDQKLIPIDIKPVSEKRLGSFFGFMKGSDYENLIMFTTSLGTMHRAGIPLLRALAVIRIGPENGRFNLVIDKLRSEIQSGRMLSESMRDYPDIFSKVYINCINAGEESGQLDVILDELAVMLEREMELTRQLKAGVRYPIMVISAIVAAFFVLINFVVPRFASFYSAFDSELPLPTRIIMATSDFCTTYWPVMLFISIGAIFGLRMLLRHESSRLWIDGKMLKIPILGDLMIRGNVARFSLMFRIMVTAGLPIVKSIEILADAVKNAAIGAEIRKLGDLFRRGKDVNIGADEFDFFPVQALHMLAIGLESGNLDDMLKEIGTHYTKQVLYTSRQLTAIIEPILTLVMGVFVLILALAIFLPMWNLIQVFKG